LAFHMRFQATYGGSWTDVDVTESNVYDMHLEVMDNAPKMLTWKMGAPQQDSPIPSGSFVQVWFDDGDYEGTSFSSSYPTFEGFCRSSPGDESNVVDYRAYDPTSKAASDITVMDEGWVVNGGGSIVVEDSAVPRTVYNCFNDRDTDWNISKVNPFVGPNNETNRFYLSEIIADILNEAVLPLQYYYAAPGSLAAPYVSADLDVTPLQWVPQDKISIQNESVRQTVIRLLTNYAPAYKCQFRCGDRKWRFYNAAAGTQRTYTLNATDLDDLVLNFWIDKSVEGRCTAVELYGPKNFGLSVFSTQDGTLSIDGGSAVVMQTYNSGLNTAIGYCTFQITDPDDRAGSRTLSQYYWAPIPVFATELSAPAGGGFRWTYQLVPTRSPTLQATWDNGSTWVTIWHPWWDFRDGTVTTGLNNPIYLYKKTSASDDQEYFPPDHYRIVYAPFSTPLSVRYPTSGFSGSAYDDENVQAVFRQYHEMLAVGYETNYYYETASGTQTIGTYVTITDRVNQYKKLAEAIHTQRSNVAWVGGIVLDGLKWDLLNLNRRINLAGRDANGDSLTTGWEDINAMATRVAYDFDEQTTTVMFSSDQLEVMGYSVELLMQQLKIKALERRVEYSQSLQWQWIDSKFSWRNAGHYELSGVTVTEHVSYVDPETTPRQSLWSNGFIDFSQLGDFWPNAIGPIDWTGNGPFGAGGNYYGSSGGYGYSGDGYGGTNNTYGGADF